MIIVLSAPSGTGKTTIAKHLLAEFPGMRQSISITTRKPRKGEIGGKEYVFVKRNEFRGMIKKNEFIEWAKVHGNFYGTPKKQLYDFLEKKKDVVLAIDVKGALNIKKQFSNSLLIFLMPPSIEVLKQRLLERGQDSKSEIKKRMNIAGKEINCAKMYDYIVENDKIKDTITQIKAIIHNVENRTKRVSKE